ncbi:MAG: hypothetical protein ACJ71S_03130 [Acidobacteriaceae bacterium]
MKSTRSFATTSFAGILLALMTAPGAAPSLAPIERELASGYHCAVRAYDRARMWSVIVRWWIDPEYAPFGALGNFGGSLPGTLGRWADEGDEMNHKLQQFEV